MLFTLIPLLELYVLIELSRLISLSATIALVILTGALGAVLARREGLRAWRRLQDSLARHESPADELINGLLILVAGAVLITPGLITDLTGFALLVPPVRRYVRRRLVTYFRDRTIVMRHPPAGPPPYEIIDPPDTNSDPHN